MTKKEAQQNLDDHEKLCQLVFGKHSDGRIEQRGKEWVLVLPVNRGVERDEEVTK